ncbi:MAG: hypothetical protein EAZ51_09635 [Sphingobacteriales bacterium]|nr:MAG: hypothetical protein EAZ64_04900 [Sphingobacteriales bacterium]TAF78362.1 MAG: hypothetical protein EAZ51_09635 [Sphingobacteriales bacterium]
MKKYIVFIFTFFLTEMVMADTWELPKIKDYYNSDSSFYVRIYPQSIPEKYSKWIEASKNKKKKFSHLDTLITPCYAMLFKVKIGEDSLIWKQKLINQIAPLKALVSKNGKFVVTFDILWGAV